MVFMWYIIHTFINCAIFHMKNNPNDFYKSARIKNDTYKELKLLAIELDMPLTQLIDFLLKHYKDSKSTLISPT